MSFFQRSDDKRLPLAASGALNGFNFTERTRTVLAQSRAEALNLRHEYVGTEHVLLGLIREGEGVAAAVLQNLGADAEALRAALFGILQPGRPVGPLGPDLPYTTRAKKVLELAMAEARELKHSYVGTEHLLLGLVREEQGIAAQVLVDAGVTLDAARAETLRLLGTEAPQPGGAPHARPAAAAAGPTTHAAGEAEAWQRLTHALDVTARLGGAPTIALEPDGSLTVSLGPELVLSVTLPADARVRRRDAGGPAGDA